MLEDDIDPRAETFGSKLLQMREDLASIVSRMNKDRSTDIALAAQEALMAVDKVHDMVDRAFSDADDLEWKWEPSGE